MVTDLLYIVSTRLPASVVGTSPASTEAERQVDHLPRTLRQLRRCVVPNTYFGLTTINWLRHDDHFWGNLKEQYLKQLPRQRQYLATIINQWSVFKIVYFFTDLVLSHHVTIFSFKGLIKSLLKIFLSAIFRPSEWLSLAPVKCLFKIT